MAIQSCLKMMDGTEQRIGESWIPIQCFRCGICCTHYRPRVTPEEIEGIARELGMAMDTFISAYTQVVPGKGTYIMKSDENKCPFLSWDKEGEKGACTIHPFRPRACRIWLASLSNPECQEGLARLKAGRGVLLVGEMYPSSKEAEEFCAALLNGIGATTR